VLLALLLPSLFTPQKYAELDAYGDANQYHCAEPPPLFIFLIRLALSVKIGYCRALPVVRSVAGE
jgi:hypothetical protein